MIQCYLLFYQLLNKNNTITSYEFIENDLGKFGIDIICEALNRKDSVIEHLKLTLGDILKKDDILDDRACNFVKTLEINQSLTSLDLSNTNMGFTAIKTLGQALKQNKTLKILNLHKSNLENSGFKALADGLLINKTLREIDLTASINKEPDIENNCNLIIEIWKNNKYLIENPFDNFIFYGDCPNHEYLISSYKNTFGYEKIKNKLKEFYFKLKANEERQTFLLLTHPKLARKVRYFNKYILSNIFSYGYSCKFLNNQPNQNIEPKLKYENKSTDTTILIQFKEKQESKKEIVDQTFEQYVAEQEERLKEINKNIKS